MHGEEFGGADLESPLVWVLDPIDGTFNYAAGSPMAAILLGLVRDGEPVAGLTWVPFTGERLHRRASANRCTPTVSRSRRCSRPILADSIVGVSTFNVDSRGSLPGRYRLAVIENLSRKCSRMRMHGATGIDLAYTAAGILGGAISFGRTSGTTRPGSRWCGRRAASSPILPATTGPRDSRSALVGRARRARLKCSTLAAVPSALRRTTDGRP